MEEVERGIVTCNICLIGSPPLQAVPPPASSLAEPPKPLPSVVVLTTQTGALGSSNLAADSGTPTLADTSQQPGGGLKQVHT